VNSPGGNQGKRSGEAVDGGAAGHGRDERNQEKRKRV